MRYLIDANCCIYLFADRHPALSRRVTSLRHGELGLSTIVLAELALGSQNGKAPPMALLDLFASRLPVLAFDEAAARAYAQLPFRRGRFDRLLAAHALSLGVSLITNNEADFADIPGLKVENWTLPA